MALSFDIQILLFLGFAIMLAGLSKGFSAFGAALIFIPLASAAVGPVSAAAIFVVIDCVAALPLVYMNRAHIDRRVIGKVAVGAFVGLPIGIALLIHTDQRLIRSAISIFCVANLFLLMFGLRFSKVPGMAMVYSTGVLSGMLHGIAQMSGPPVLLLWFAMRYTKEKIRASALLYFFLLTLTTFFIFLSSSVVNWDTIMYSMILIPVYAAGLIVGSLVFEMSSERFFRGISFALIACAAIVSLPLLDEFFRR